MEFATTDLCDQFSEELDVCGLVLRNFGGRHRCAGAIATIKCFEDNSRVRELVAEPGAARVLVVDAGGSMRRAVLGDLLAQQAVDNGWSGIVIYGCVRDAAAIARMPIAVKALGTCPMKTDKRGEGQRDLTLRFGEATFRPGEWLYSDEDGLLVARRALL
jgi:regulator of ribonuclease activity A